MKMYRRPASLGTAFFLLLLSLACYAVPVYDDKIPLINWGITDAPNPNIPTSDQVPTTPTINLRDLERSPSPHDAAHKTQTTAQKEKIDLIRNSSYDRLPGVPRRNSQTSAKELAKLYTPCYFLKEWGMTAFSFENLLAPFLSQYERKSNSVVKLEDSRPAKRVQVKATPPPDNSGKLIVNDPNPFIPEEISIVPSTKDTPNPPLLKKGPKKRKLIDSMKAKYAARRKRIFSMSINHQSRDTRFACIDDEDRSFKFYSGVLSYENASDLDSYKMKILAAMMHDDPADHVGKPLSIAEDELEEEVLYYHNMISQSKWGPEGIVVYKSEKKGANKNKRHSTIREDRRVKAVAMMHEKRDAWISFYEAKCGMKFQDLGLTDDEGLVAENVKTDLVLFLLRVDMISSVVRKGGGGTGPLIPSPSGSQEKSIPTNRNNIDILKYAAEHYPSISRQAWGKLYKDNLMLPHLDRDLGTRTSKLRAAEKVKVHIVEWLKLAAQDRTQATHVPHISFMHAARTMTLFHSFFEDIWFYTSQLLREEINDF
ncbi:hypothetical protein PCANC_02141 [Puccinia coronata f. sp. avenae]|uniref:Uncharacterized protein n=1 Tax=Puccinia coronata f. sp. avenae TaxID=200324 RepID=A0A2N5W005_9BASI|nr:hypothetical protein PCANC_02141 [Puccinia coronata f. sp. avenae]